MLPQGVAVRLSESNKRHSTTAEDACGIEAKRHYSKTEFYREILQFYFIDCTF